MSSGLAWSDVQQERNQWLCQDSETDAVGIGVTVSWIQNQQWGIWAEKEEESFCLEQLVIISYKEESGGQASGLGCKKVGKQTLETAEWALDFCLAKRVRLESHNWIQKRTKEPKTVLIRRKNRKFQNNNFAIFFLFSFHCEHESADTNSTPHFLYPSL